MNTITRYKELNDSESSSSFDIESLPPQKERLNYRTAFFAISVLYIATLGLFSVAWTTRNPPESSHSHIVDDFALLHTQALHDRTVIFAPQPQYEIVGSSQSVDDPWRELLPHGRGFIKLPPNTLLPDGSLTTSADSDWSITVFHQMHCIASLKAAFESLSDPKTNNTDQMHHYAHCFDYLLQGVMCAGDSTLEPANGVPDRMGEVSVDGWNVTHQCRDFQLIYDFAEKHRFRNTTGIL